MRIIKILLRAGAKVHLRTETGVTALSLAEQLPREAIVDLLREAGEREDPA